MGRWPTGVSVVTAHHDGVDSGLTVNAFLSVSTAPPLLLVSLTHDAETTPAIRAAHHFAVNLLAADQRPVSERFARQIPAAEKFQDLPLHRGRTGAPLLNGTLAAFECRLTQEIPVQDHRLFLGEVVAAEASVTGRPPLLFFLSQYAESTDARTLRLPDFPAERP
jgi:flavin reductase (DIM6/NTAB) family NADH-FMN oxidoreductase RutF